MHGAVIDRDLTGIGVDRGERMLHPVDVITRGKIFPRMGAAGFGAARRTIHGDDRLDDEIVEFQGLDEIRIPNQRTVGDRDLVSGGPDLTNELRTLLQYRPGAVDRAMGLHHLLHPEPQLGGRNFALGMAEAVEAGKRLAGGIRRKLRLLGARRHEFRRAQTSSAAEDNKVDERIRAEFVGAMDGDAGGLADRHEAGHDGIGNPRPS